MSKRDVLNSPRLSELKKNRRQNFQNKILVATLGFAVIFIFLSFLSRINRLNISDVKITGNNIVDTDIIKAEVEQEISGHYFWIFPKTNVFLYPQDKLKTNLGEKFKRLKDINLSIVDRTVLAISVTERAPKYTWCGAELPVSSSTEKCYFLDSSGYIFDEAPYFSGDVYFRFYGDLPKDVSGPYGSYFSQNIFSKLTSFKDMIEGMGAKPVALALSKDGSGKIYLSNSSILPMGPEILFKTDADFEKLAENLQAALTTEPFQTDFKQKYLSLSYIDLRFGNKVYYKFR